MKTEVPLDGLDVIMIEKIWRSYASRQGRRDDFTCLVEEIVTRCVSGDDKVLDNKSGTGAVRVEGTDGGEDSEDSKGMVSGRPGCPECESVFMRKDEEGDL